MVVYGCIKWLYMDVCIMVVYACIDGCLWMYKMVVYACIDGCIWMYKMVVYGCLRWLYMDI